MLILLSILMLQTAHADCFSSGQGCADVDMSHPRAEEAYRKGCDSGEAYSCARLGQFYEVKKSDLAKAAPLYDRACKAKDSFGCEAGDGIHERLCFLEEVKSFCDGREPRGEYRIYVYLQKFEPKYADAFRSHNFEGTWSIDAAERLYQKRISEKNKTLLKTLQKEKKSRRHDGADAEMLSHDIECLKGKCTNLEDEFL